MITDIKKLTDPADAITFVVTTFKQRDQWSRKTASDPRVKLMHGHVLRSLALFAHTDSGGTLVFDQTYDELAKAARCHKRTAQRAVAVAEEIGIVRKARHSDGRVSNAYELLLPQAVSNGDKFAVPTVTNSNRQFQRWQICPFCRKVPTSRHCCRRLEAERKKGSK